MTVADLPTDVQRHILVEAAKHGPQPRGVCRDWRTLTDELMHSEYEDVMCAMLGACRFRVTERTPLKWRMRYVYAAAAPRAPRYRCASCGHQVYEVANCWVCRDMYVRRFPVTPVLVGPGIAMVVSSVFLFFKGWFRGLLRLS